MIIPYLADLINEQKNKRDESKIQINMGVNLSLLKIQEKFALFLYGGVMEKLDQVMKHT